MGNVGSLIRPRAHEMGIYKRYFDLIASGRKTVEIRVNDSSRRRITEGNLIRFRCRDEEVLTRVTRVARYHSFEEMFDHEPVTASTPPPQERSSWPTSARSTHPSARPSGSSPSASSSSIHQGEQVAAQVAAKSASPGSCREG